MMPPKPRANKSKIHPKKVLSRNELQALHGKSTRKAMDALRGAKQVNCQVPADQLFSEKQMQFDKKEMVSGSFELA